MRTSKKDIERKAKELQAVDITYGTEKEINAIRTSELVPFNSEFAMELTAVFARVSRVWLPI